MMGYILQQQCNQILLVCPLYKTKKGPPAETYFKILSQQFKVPRILLGKYFLTRTITPSKQSQLL